MSKTKRQTKPNPTTIRLYPECEKRLLKIARAHNCINTSGRYKGQESWRVFLDQLRMRDDGTLYVSTTGDLLVEKVAEAEEDEKPIQ